MTFLDDGLDEMAARAYHGLPLRIAATLGVAGLSTLLLPWRISIVWALAQVTLEVAAGFITRRQFLGYKASPGLRSLHLLTIVIGCGLWTVLCGLLWTSGTPEAAACAMILWLAVIFFAQNNAYQSTTGFLFGAGIPAWGMLTLMIAGPNPMHLTLLPVIGMALIALGFVGDGVMRSLAIRRRFEETQSKLVASEAQYRMLADNITDVLWLNRFDGSRIYISPSVTRALGYSPEEVFGDNFSMVHPQDADRVRLEFETLAISGNEGTIECRMVHKDGRVIWTETHVDVVPDADGGHRPMLISVTRNIDARKELESQLVEARHRAEEAAASKADFLANMTHELRTPLNAIVGFSGILKDSQRLAAEDARHAHLINEASDSLLVLVNSVLDFSKLEAGGIELEDRAFDPRVMADSAVALMHEQARAKGLELRVEVSGDVLPMIGDEARLRQVLLNFLSNAVKFTARGGATVHLSQSPEGDGHAALSVRVSDTGIGISPDQIDHLFDRFTQADATVSRQYGGTGLGLAICKKTLELMNGAIGCESVPGEGSTFWIELTLPISEQLPNTTSAEIRPPDSPLRVLVVEDVPVNRELIATLLSPFDIELSMAENGLVALDAMQREAFDIVLMDVQMPVMDGLTATRAIRALPAPGALTTPIIAMTANVLPDQIQRCLDAGMNDHIGKPISPASLLNALSRWSPEPEADDSAPGVQAVS